MQLLKLVTAGAIVTALFTAAMIPSIAHHRVQASLPWSCETDAECTQECLAKCGHKIECDSCWDVFIDSDNYDLYERRIAELEWKEGGGNR